MICFMIKVYTKALISKLRLAVICTLVTILYCNQTLFAQQTNLHISSFATSNQPITPTQGMLAIVHTIPNTKLMLDGNEVIVSKQGKAIIGWGYDHQKLSSITAIYPDTSSETLHITLKNRTYDVQHIKGLKQQHVNPPPETMKRIKRESTHIRTLRAKPSLLEYWENGFQWPTEGIITGVFGSQRILNEKPRAPHYGYDIAAPAQTPIYAPADGKVILAAEDLYFSGATMLIDHGYGVISALLHLDAFNVSKNFLVKKGQLIGWVGNTGRSTGPHLDWRVSWFNKRMDAALLITNKPIIKGASVKPDIILE